MTTLSSIIAQARALLSGEPLRAITYGALVVVWVVTHAAFSLGIVATPPPTFDVMLAAIAVAVAALNEAIRLFVYSPATVAAAAPASDSVAPPPV